MSVDFVQKMTLDEDPACPSRTHSAADYRNSRCVCETGRQLNREYSQRMRTVRWEKTRDNGGVAPTVKHGRSTYVNWGCRCEVCTADNSAALKHYRRSGRYTT
jgi:hypothetical protein